VARPDPTGPGPDPGVGPFAELLGVRRTLMAGGRARFEVTVGPQHLNPHGIVHGGVVYSLVDYAMGGALTSRLAPGERCATLEIKINYLQKPRGANTDNTKREIVADVKKNTEMVTPATNQELGTDKVTQTISTAITNTEKTVEQPAVEDVEENITKQIDKFFADSRSIIEENTGEMPDKAYGHLKNDLVGLFGKLTFYYKKEKKEMNLRSVQMGVVNFATEIFNYKKDRKKLEVDLADKELDELFDTYNSSSEITIVKRK